MNSTFSANHPKNCVIENFNRRNILTFLCFNFLISQFAFSQGLEGIIVERFYETEAADEADAFDNGSVVPLPQGSVVYRVYADMADGYKFSQIYGTIEHPLTVSATSDFYNDPSYGVTINPATISASNIRKHTAMIDSWLALGGASNGKVGVLKIEDTDGSVGNQHNVLANNPGGCYGVPITGTNAQDGMTPNSSTTYLLPNALGIGSSLEALDQTPGNSLMIDNGAIAALGGIVGPTSTNRVLLAQFTVDGDITFALNLQLINVSTGIAENYVSANPVNGELTHPTLTYNSNIAPVASITSPSNGSTIGIGNNIIAVNASDFQGSVSFVEFFVDGNSIGIDQTAPYEVTFNATTGNHVITAIATDGDCLTGSALAVNVSVANNQSPAIVLSAPSTAVEGSFVTLNANASDPDGTIIQVQFFVNGLPIGTDSSAPYSAVWTATLGQLQPITAIATDNSGLTSTSQPIFIDVNPNVAPTVSLISPLSTDDFTAPEIVNILADAIDVDGTIVSVEFFLNEVSIGVVNDSPFSINWMSIAGPAEIYAVATDSNGATATSLSVNILVLDPSTEPYAVSVVTQLCDVPTYCIPVEVSPAFPITGVIGYDITMNYDPAMLSPTGNISVSNDLINPQFVDAVATTISAGEVQITLVLNGSAPAFTSFQGYGDLFCIEFTRLIAFQATDSTEISVSSLIESYASGNTPVNVNAANAYSELNTQLNGDILHWLNNSPLNNNETQELDTPVTQVFGVINSQITNPDNASLVAPTGEFSHDLNLGSEISIEREIDDLQSVQGVINGQDAYLVNKLLSGASFVPNVFQMLAMDVNLDGSVTAGDISQINQRASLMIGEYQQAWNYDDQGNSNGPPSKDWIFVDQSRLNDPEFTISTTFPSDDLTGYSPTNLPSVTFTHDLDVVGFNPNINTCEDWGSKNYVAILLGDVDGNYDNQNPNTQDSIKFDLSQALFTTVNDISYIEIPLVLENINVTTSIDAALQFNQMKLAFNGIVDVQTAISTISNYNNNDEYLRITSFLNDENVTLNNGSILVHLKFELLDECASIFSTDFSNITVWVNGTEAAYRIIDGATLPDAITIVTNAPYCSGSEVDFSYSDMIDGQMISNYQWEFGDGSSASGQNVTASINGSGVVPITLNLTSVNGCSYVLGGEIIMSPLPQVSFTYTYDANSSTATFDNTSTIAGGSITAFSWNFGDGNNSDLSEPTHNYLSTGTYQVVLIATSNQGCISEYSATVNASVGIDEQELSHVQAYPNPASYYVHVTSPVAGILNVTDQTGKIVMENVQINASAPIQLDIRTLADGFYNMTVVRQDGTYYRGRILKVNQ